MLIKCFIINFIILISSSKVHHLDKKYLIIWDVGQGQWLTLYDASSCTHFDMGGEYAPMKQILNLCKYLKNNIYFTHADHDHIKFFNSYIQTVKHACLGNYTLNFFKKTKIHDLEKCPVTKKYSIYYPRQKKIAKDLNSLSVVFQIKNFFLNPGDSPVKNEIYWRNKESLNRVQVLLLGHHGSLTSTSEMLLNKLPMLKWTIASARKKRYGHPHGLIEIRMKQNKTPIISTNDWGSIWIEL